MRPAQLASLVLVIAGLGESRSATADASASGTSAERMSDHQTLVAQVSPEAEASGARKATFEYIYRKGVWGTNAEGVPNSGTGSTMQATVIYRAFLQQFLKDNNIKSVIDAGCGDWEFSQAIDWTGIDYKGYDIVKSVVTADRKKFGKPNIQFFTADIVAADLPPADLLISKEVLQHLPNEAVTKFLGQLPKYKHVLLVDGVNKVTLSAPNDDIAVGNYRELDPTRPPFNLVADKPLTYWDGLHMHQVVHVINSALSAPPPAKASP